MFRHYFYCVCLCVLAVGDSAFGQEPTLTWKALEKNEPFYLEMTTSAVQEFIVEKTNYPQKHTQTFWYRWTPSVMKDGKYEVAQKILGLTIQCDSGGNKLDFDSRNKSVTGPTSQFFASLIETELTLSFDPMTMDVEKVHGIISLRFRHPMRGGPPIAAAPVLVLSAQACRISRRTLPGAIRAPSHVNLRGTQQDTDRLLLANSCRHSSW